LIKSGSKKIKSTKKAPGIDNVTAEMLELRAL